MARLRGIGDFERDHPMYYADILPRPTGEMLGDMLVQMNKPAEALTAYQAALKLAPNRLDSLLGAIKAAKLIGQQAIAKQYSAAIREENGLFPARP